MYTYISMHIQLYLYVYTSVIENYASIHTRKITMRNNIAIKFSNETSRTKHIYITKANTQGHKCLSSIVIRALAISVVVINAARAYTDSRVRNTSMKCHEEECDINTAKQSKRFSKKERPARSLGRAEKFISTA